MTDHLQPHWAAHWAAQAEEQYKVSPLYFSDKKFSVPAGCYDNIIQQIVPELYKIF